MHFWAKFVEIDSDCLVISLSFASSVVTTVNNCTVVALEVSEPDLVDRIAQFVECAWENRKILFNQVAPFRLSPLEVRCRADLSRLDESMYSCLSALSLSLRLSRELCAAIALGRGPQCLRADKKPVSLSIALIVLTACFGKSLCLTIRLSD